MNKIKAGFFIPPPVSFGESASIHSPGIGRLPHKTQQKLKKLIKETKGVEIYDNLNFRKSFILNGRVYIDDFCLNDLDIYFWYCEIDRSIGSYDLEVLKTLSDKIKVVINPYKFELALDKYKSHLAIKNSGGQTPCFILFDYENLDLIKKQMSTWGPCMLKPRRGGFGKGVTLIENFAALRDIVEYIHTTSLETPDKAYFIEKYYEHSHSDWVSATMINNELIYGYRKKITKLVQMSNGKNKVYDHNEIGGEVDLCEIPPSYKEAAKKAYRAIGAEIIGFDMITNGKTPIIIDENTFPGYYEDLFDQVHIDSAENFYQMIVLEIKKLQHR